MVMRMPIEIIERADLSTPHAQIAALAAEYWRKRLEANPLEATMVGERRMMIASPT